LPAQPTASRPGTLRRRTPRFGPSRATATLVACPIAHNTTQPASPPSPPPLCEHPALACRPARLAKHQCALRTTTAEEHPAHPNAKAGLLAHLSRLGVLVRTAPWHELDPAVNRHLSTCTRATSTERTRTTGPQASHSDDLLKTLYAENHWRHASQARMLTRPAVFRPWPPPPGQSRPHIRDPLLPPMALRHRVQVRVVRTARPRLERT
jgi:hypothetical protein